MKRTSEIIASRGRKVLEARRRVLRHGNGKTIHDLRVATRRLQAALDVFAPSLPEPQRRLLERRARKIRRHLGTQRNAWVTLELLRGLRGGLTPPEKTFVDGLEKKMKKTVKDAPGHGGEKLPGLRKRLKAIESALEEKAPSDAAAERSAALTSSAGAVRRAGRIAAAGDPEALHRLRIAIKKHRYTLEILSDAGQAGLERAIDEARALQKDLGGLHDLDVLIEIVRRRARQRGAAALLGRLRHTRQVRREPILSRVAAYDPGEGADRPDRPTTGPRRPASRRSPEAGAAA